MRVFWAGKRGAIRTCPRIESLRLTRAGLNTRNQDNRDLRKGGEMKKYSFMLRLKSPAGEITPELYKVCSCVLGKDGGC